MTTIVIFVTLACLFVLVSSVKRRGAGRGSEDPWPQLPPSALPANALKIPLFRQATYYTCGVASLDAILHYWQVYDDIEASLAEECGTTEEDGTPPQNLVKVAQSYNLTAYLKENTSLKDLEKAVEEGWTVILDVQAWSEQELPVDWKNDWEDGHYVVLLALDDQYVFLMDPSTGATYAYVPRLEFMDRWHDYEILSDGSRYNYVQTAIFIKGEHALPSPPPIFYMG